MDTTSDYKSDAVIWDIREAVAKLERDKWVQLENIKDENGYSTTQLLESKLLLSCGKGTPKAYNLDFVRQDGTDEVWHLKKYIELMKAQKKVDKLLAKGKSVHRAYYRRAMMHTEAESVQ